MKRAPKPSRNPAGRPKDASKRADIVRAAETLFMQKGYEGTSVLAVAKKASVSKLTIYSHFADKDALFREVITERCNQYITPDSFIDFADKPVRETLIKIGHRFTALLFNNDALCLHRLVHGEVGRHPNVVKIFFEAGPKRVRGEFTALLEAWKKRGKIQIADPYQAAGHFFALIKGEMHMRSILRITPAPTPAEIEKHVQGAIFVFLSAYKDKK
jgi:TetR/AcrR family transcriptional repressor of mexJK operon